MAKNHYTISKTKKSVIALLSAAAIACTGFAAACTTPEEDKNPTADKREDTQLLKNGDFEFFNYPSKEYIEKGKSAYLITTPDNWTRSGDSSNAMSGIINTSTAAWSSLTDEGLKDKLDYNNDLSSTDEKYVDYNGMRSRDIPYKDTYAAMLEADDVKDSYIKNQTYEEYFGIRQENGKFYIGENTEVFKKTVAEGEGEDIEYYFDADCTKPVRKQLIANPGTHYGNFNEKDGEAYYGTTKVTKGDNDSYYYKNGDKETYISNVLMIHNYPTTGSYNGISQYYASQSITLEAHTAAEISLWVKTSDLKFDKGYNQNNDQDRGAFIEVEQTVAGSTIDSFVIKAINTEKIIANNKDNSVVKENESNGWLKYTVYVKACDFGESTVKLNLGLGRSEDYEKCTGYAFFDDVSVTKYIDLEDATEGSDSYKQHKNELGDTTYTLTAEDDKKVYVADTDDRNNSSDKTSPAFLRNSRDFYYLIDLASEASGYNAFAFNTNVTAMLTSEKKGGTTYAANTQLSSVNSDNISLDQSTVYTLPSGLKNHGGIVTSSDLLGTYAYNATFKGSYANKLKKELTGENGIDKLPGYLDTNNMLVMLSAYGASYTSTVKADNTFTLDKGDYKIISFWVKTSDMNGNTAATVKLVPLNTNGERDEDAIQTFKIDTTGKTTDINDKKDLYNGWVQCFILVENDSKDSSTRKFEIDFCFGSTELADSKVTSFNHGWAAFANMQIMSIDKDIYDIAGTGDYKIKYSFSDKEDKDGNPFDSVGSTSDIKNEYANASSYNGVNGGSSNVTDNDFKIDYDEKNTNSTAGLINKDDTDSAIIDAVLKSFMTSNASWEKVFGNDCYQPLIIVNNLRRYAEKATATEETFNNGNYYVKAGDSYTGDSVTDERGNKYRKVTDTDTFDENETYYSIHEVMNYGFVGESKTIGSDSYETVSVRVNVSDGAVAYVYLVDSNTRKVLTYGTPSRTFYYDDEGNVLDAEFDENWENDEHRSHIVYTLRDDGLYNNKNGSELFANTWNLKRSYKYYKYESNSFFDANGNAVSFDDLEEGKVYYSNKTHNIEADHFLVNSDGKRVYEYTDAADGNGKTYYYLVDGARSVAVKPFDTKYVRYDSAINEEYAVKVTPTNNEWATVNFIIHTGNKELNYRLELWSGERDKQVTDRNITGGAVAFDYSAFSVGSEDYSNVIGAYETSIISEYKNLLKDKGLLDKITSDNENIAYYESLIKELIADNELTEIEVNNAINQNHLARYYTYTLYDSEAYVPFNATVAAEGETGYKYNMSDYEETLAFFKYEDKENNSYNVFADYSAINQTVETGSTDEETPDDEEEGSGISGEIWLLVSSIILVIALLFTLLSLVLRDMLKKRRVKSYGKNSNNNYRQRKRYIRKLHLVENEQSDENTETADENSDATANIPVEEIFNAETEEVKEDSSEDGNTSDE